jgi:hypothetical protein
MSDIWTPGSKPSQPSGGGIELPKGFARRRKTEESETKEAESTEPTVEEAVPAKAAEAPAQRRPAQSGARKEMLFPPSGVQVQCPNCGTPFTAPVFSIIDLGANPELRQALLGGQINLAVCPNCGAGGALSAPLMVHDPENEFLGVLVPTQAQLKDVQIQKVIGEMSQALMRRLPNEARRGYMLQARQYHDWDRFLEKFWEFEGVSPEELHRQRDQSELISSLVRLANDETAMRMVVERKKHLVDENFFALLGQVIQLYTAQGQEENLDAVRKLRTHLMETTEAGSKVKALEGQLRTALERIKPETSRDELLDILMEYWAKGPEGERIVAAILSMTRGIADYQFLMAVSERIERTKDEETRADLIELRNMILELSQQQNQSREALAQHAQAVLQEILQAPDTEAKLREHADDIDEMFLTLLSANIQQAEEKGATFAVKRLTAVYNQAMAILQENLPEDVRLLNQLLTAPDEATVRNLLKENRSLLNQEFLSALRDLEDRFRKEGGAEMAGRLKGLRSQISLML